MFVASTCVIRGKSSLHLFNSVRSLGQFSYGNTAVSKSKVKITYSAFNYSRRVASNDHNTERWFLSNAFGHSRQVQTLASVQPPLVSSTQTSKKRPVRRKTLDEELKLKYNSVFAFATADEYDMELLKDGFAKNTIYKSTDIDEFKRLNLLHVRASPPNGESKEMYIFEEGSVVFWNIPQEECFNILKFIKQFEIGSYNESIVQNEQEEMPYTYGEDDIKSDLVNGLITLARDRGDVQSALDKYTFSNAMTLSVKLGIWECILECYIADVKLLTEDLKLGRKIRISSKEVLKKTGELFSLRHAVNLSSDALDVPDFYWDLETQEKIYIKMVNYFAINRRTTVVNEKLNHCLELLDLLSSQLNDKHHVRLEWMIIILITVEVAIAIVHS